MSRERWSRVRKVFQSARQLQGDERSSFLRRTCGADDGLRQEVEELLLADERAGSFLSEPAILSGGMTHPPLSTDDRIGPYLISEKIADGGMGEVYLAVRDDEVFTKRVALKLVREGLPDDQSEQRFRRERRILAHLNHPNIASIFDGGTTEDGRPYLIMEFVEGSPIDEHCEERLLSSSDRIALFQQVCQAVHYAHQHLVVHRDIKPANVLITTDGVPKLVDFGIATLLEDQPFSIDAEPTGGSNGLDALPETRRGLMTPAYASPEQKRGHPLSTASDIYSLGVVLYQLLTGALPAARNSATAPSLPEGTPQNTNIALDEIADSPVVGHAGLFQPELEAIVAKALSENPEDRYGSAEQFAKDLGRYLSGLPVDAYPDNHVYRVRKFVLRHRFATFATAALVVVLLSSSLVTMTLYRRADAARKDALSARRLAVEHARTTDEVSEFLIGLFEVSDPDETQGGSLTSREILDKGVATIEEELSGEPLVQARLMESLGKIHTNLALYDEARHLLRDSLALRRSRLGDVHVEVADGLHALARHALAIGNADEALTYLEEALDIRRTLLGETHVDFAKTLSAQSFAFNVIGKSADARDAALRAIAIFEASESHPATNASYPLALNNLARALQSLGDVAAAVPIMEKVRRIMEETRPEGHPDVARALNNLGAAYFRLGEYSRSLEVFENALQQMEQSLGPDHPNVGVLVNNLALIAKRNGELERARALYTRSIEIHENTVGDDNAEIAGTIVNIANLHRQLNDYELALEQYRRAIEILTETRATPAVLLRAHLQLGETLLELGEDSLASNHLNLALETATANSGPDSVDVAFVLNSLAELDRKSGHLLEALRRIRRAFPILDRELSLAHDARIACLVEWSLILVAQGEITASEEKWRLLETAYSTLDEIPASRFLDEARYWATRGDAVRTAGLAQKAEEHGIPRHRILRTFELGELYEANPTNRLAEGSQ